MNIASTLDIRSDNKTSRKLLYIVLVVYVVWNAITIYFHEPWRDEAQSYLLCRDLNFEQLFDIMNVEGHSCLWHILVFPWIKLGAPIYIQNAVSLVLCSVAAWIVLFKSPLPSYVNVALVFCPALAYYYPVVARCYALIPFALFLNVMLFPKRKEKPYLYCLTIAILVQTHVFMIVMAFLLSVWFAIEQLVDGIHNGKLIKKLCPLLLPLGSAILLLVQLMPNPGNFYTDNPVISFPVSLLLFGTSYIGDYSDIAIMAVGFISFIMGAAFVAVVYKSKLETRIAAAIMVVVVFGFNLMDVFIYPFRTDQKMSLAVVVIAWGFMMIGYDKENSKRKIAELFMVAFAVIIAVMCIKPIRMAIQDINGDYSYAYDAAMWINDNVPAGSAIYTNNSSYASSLLPYCVNYDTFEFEGTEFSYINWNSRWRIVDYEDYSELEDSLPDEGYYIVENYEIAERLEKMGYNAVYRSAEDSIIGENYIIFKID